MMTKAISTIVMILTVGAASAMAETTQHEGHITKNAASQSEAHGMKGMSHEQMMVANEPHHVLAMAYHRNLANFAKALQEQTARASSVNIVFAHAAAAEMRRSFDQMKQHHQEHMQTMSAEMHAKMSGIMQQMETHQTEMVTQLTALEQEIQLSTPDAMKVATLAASIQTHLDAMSKMHQGSPGRKMKMKM